MAQRGLRSITIVRWATLLGAAQILVANASVYAAKGAPAMAGGLMMTWIGAGIGLYASVRYSTRQLWLATIGAFIAATWAAIPVWNEIHGQPFFSQ